MDFKSRSFIIDISPENTKQVVYKDLSIPVDYDLLKRNSEYISSNDITYNSKDKIYLLLEEGNDTEFPYSSIQEFVKCCQNQRIDINQSNLFYLNYLSKRYGVKKLEKETSDIISSDKGQLALESLIFILNINKNKQLIYVETGKEEDVISANFEHFIKDEKIYQIPLPILYRIVHRFYIKNKEKLNTQNDSKFNDEFTNFLFKLLDLHQGKASVFFQFFNIDKSRLEDLFKLHDCYSDVFNPNFLNSSLFETTIELAKEMSKLKSELNEIKKISDDQKQSLEKEREKNDIKENELIEIKKEIDKMKESQKSLELWKKIQMNHIGDYQNMIPIGKKWTQGENINIFRLIDNKLTYEVSASSTYNSNYYIEKLFNGQKEPSGFNSWATVDLKNDKNPFIQIKFPIPTIINVLVFTSRYFANQSPTSFEVFGINDQNQEKLLGSFIQSEWAACDKKLFPFFNEQPYNIYKIKFYSSSGNTYIALAELNLGKINQ